MHKNYNMDPKQRMSVEGAHLLAQSTLLSFESTLYMYNFIVLALRRLNLAVKATQPFCTQALVLRNSCILT